MKELFRRLSIAEHKIEILEECNMEMANYVTKMEGDFQGFKEVVAEAVGEYFTECEKNSKKQSKRTKSVSKSQRS